MTELKKVLVLVGFTLVVVLGYRDGRKDVMKEAFNRGYAVQCLGKTGYYWECEG